MNRPLGASTFIWVSPFADTELQLASHVRELGFDVLEVCVEQPDLLTGAAVSRAAEDNELGISVCGAFGRDRDASDPDPRTRSNALDYLKRCIELAAAVGSPHVAGPMYAAIILISSDLPELLSLSDRIAVMRQGRVVGVVPASQATEESLVKEFIGVAAA